MTARGTEIVRARGRVGSFALAQAVRRGGWINGAPSRPFSDPYLADDGPQPGYLAGGGPQPGWQTRAFDAALHQAIAAGASQEQAEAFFAPLFGRG